jgi:hypothetical protein
MSCYTTGDVAYDSAGGNQLNGTAFDTLNDFNCKIGELFNFTEISGTSLCDLNSGFLSAGCVSEGIFDPYYTGVVTSLTLDCGNNVEVNGTSVAFDNNAETAAIFDELFMSEEFGNLQVGKLTISDCQLNGYPDLTTLDELKEFEAFSNTGPSNPPQIPDSVNATQCDFKLDISDSILCQDLDGTLATYNSTCGSQVTLKDLAFDEGCCEPIEHADEGSVIVCTSDGSKFAAGFPNCSSGYFATEGVNVDECTECTAVNNSATEDVSCTSSSDSRVTACSSGFYKLDGGVGEADECTGCTPIVGSTGALSCTDEDDSRTTACAEGKYILQGVLNDTCAECMAVEGGSGNVTCTNASDSRVAACTPPKIKLAGEMADTCVDNCGEGKYASSSNLCTLCEPIEGSSGTVSCSTNLDSTTTACATGRYKVSGTPDTCPECSPIANKAADASVTCTNATDSKLDGGCAANFTKVQGMADTCTQPEDPDDGSSGSGSGDEPTSAAISAMPALVFMALSFF